MSTDEHRTWIVTESSPGPPFWLDVLWAAAAGVSALALLCAFLVILVVA